MPVLSTLYKWAAIIGGAIAAVFVALFLGRRQGEKAASNEAAAEAAKTTVHAAQTRTEVENEVARLDPSEASEVGTAPPDSAAGKLRDRWSRD